MARIFIDGFEGDDMVLWTDNATASIAAAQAGMSGNYCLDLTGSGDRIWKNFPSNLTAIYLSCKFRVSTNASFSLSFVDSNAVSLTHLMRNTTSGLFELRLGTSSGSIVATGTHAMSTNNTYLIEVHYIPLNSGGTYDVKVDGASDITYSGDTTYGAENFNRFGFGYSGGPAGYIDDVVLDDAGWIGMTQIKGVTVSNAGTTTQWTASTGSNYECVNDIPYSDSDYVYTNTANYIDTYACADVTVSGTVKCLQVHARARKTGAPTPQYVQLVVRSGGSDYASSSKEIPTAFGGSAGAYAIWETNPADSLAWEDADLDAVEIGVKAVTT